MNFFKTLLTLSLVWSIHSELAPLYTAKSDSNKYLVQLKTDTRTTFKGHLDRLSKLLPAQSYKVLEVYEQFNNLYLIEINPKSLEKLRSISDISYIEQDNVYTTKAEQTNAPWNLARISQRQFVNKSTYTYFADGSGVAVYIVDTGVQVTHPEFEGRASYGANYSNEQNNDDLNGHGTYCAAIVGGKTYGIAKKTNLISVKVLSGSGSGTTSSIIQGLEWIIKDKRGKKGNVIAIPLGGSKSIALNDVIEKAYANGFVIAAPAGNENSDACNFSPGSSPNAITAAATDVNDNYSNASNYGSCVDVAAPGTNVISAWKGNGTNSISGTSVAACHIAGLAAYYLSLENLTNVQVRNKIVNNGTKGILKNVKPNTANVLTYNGATGAF